MEKAISILSAIEKPSIKDYKRTTLPFDYWIGVDTYLSGNDYYFALITKYGHVDIKSYKNFDNGVKRVSAFLDKFNN